MISPYSHHPQELLKTIVLGQREPVVLYGMEKLLEQHSPELWNLDTIKKKYGQTKIIVSGNKTESDVVLRWTNLDMTKRYYSFLLTPFLTYPSPDNRCDIKVLANLIQANLRFGVMIRKI